MPIANLISENKWWNKPFIIIRALCGLLAILASILVFLFSKIFILLLIAIPVISLGLLFLFRFHEIFYSIEIYDSYLLVKYLWVNKTISFKDITGYKEGFMQSKYQLKTYKALHFYSGDKRKYEIPINDYSNYQEIKSTLNKHIENLGEINSSSTGNGFFIWICVFIICLLNACTEKIYNVQLQKSTKITDLVAVKGALTNDYIEISKKSKTTDKIISLHLNPYNTFIFQTIWLSSEYYKEVNNNNLVVKDNDTITIYICKDEYEQKLALTKPISLFYQYCEYYPIALYGIEKNGMVYLDKNSYINYLSPDSIEFYYFIFLLDALLSIILLLLALNMAKNSLKYYLNGGEIT